MKISFWDVLTGILMFAGFGVVLVFANIFIDPYTILNPFPPPTIQPTLKIPTPTPTHRTLPDIWTTTPTGNAQTTTLLPSLTPLASSTGFTLVPSSTNTPIPSLTPVGTNTPTRTNTPYGGYTYTPTRTRTPTNTSTSSSFAITSVQYVSASPSSWNGVCPKSFTLSATIYYTNDGTMTYYWIRSSDNAQLGSGSFDFDGTSPDTFTSTLSLGTAGYVNTSTYYLYVDYPNHQQFGGVTIPIVCTGLITSNGGGDTAAISLAENTTTVTTVTTSPTGSTFSITGGSDAADFSINASSGVLTFNVAPDYENPHDSDTNNTYVVNVHAVNGSTTDDQLITITVTDVNEFTPVITSNGGGGSAAISVAENTTAVTTVTATDGDGTASLTYSISGGADAARFSIVSGTGVLTFATAPNFEVPTDAGTNNVYDVTVQVSDGTNTDTQDIAVTVTNAPPVISSNGGGATASISVEENTTAVTTVIASDGDANTTMTYSITAGDDMALFSIDPSTGVLTFNTAPDYENPTDSNTDNTYVVTVQASDGTDTDSQVITIPVTNVAPTITSDGGGATAAISMQENITAVTTVAATDPAGGTITYSISGGADSALFSIDGGTGALAFLAAPDFETPTDADTNNEYIVEVTASDGSLTDTQTITVTITDDPSA